MSNALLNSLSLLNEIRDQLNSNKPNFQSSQKQNNDENTKSETIIKKIQIDSPLPANPFLANGDTTTWYLKFMNDNEYIKSEFITKTNIDKVIMPSVSTNKEFSGITKSDDSSLSLISKNTLKLSIFDKETPNIINEKSNINVNISPYKRKFVHKDKKIDNFHTEKNDLKANDIVQNIKLMINKELDQFNKQCDSIKEKLTSVLANEADIINIKSLSIGKNLSNNLNTLQNEYIDQDMKNNEKYSTVKIAKKDSISNQIEDTNNTISKKIERLMGDIEVKKVAALTIKPNIRDFPNIPIPYSPEKNIDYNTPTIGSGQEVFFSANMNESKITSGDQQYSFEGDKD